MCAAAKARGENIPSTLPSRLSLGAAIVDFHPQLGPVSYPACAPLRVTRELVFRQVYDRVDDSSTRRLQSGMAEKPLKDKSVLGTLPQTRPQRLGAPRHTEKPERTPKPRAVTPGAAELECKHEAPPPRALEPPRGTELVSTAVRATGELAQIGVMLGGRALKRALRRH